jgi:chemosensory pili system protein ChpC
MTERIAEVYSLLIPLAEARLLVPRACVAEVIGYQTPAPMDSAPPWYLGLVNWSARTLPLVSFEGACGLMIPPASSRSRIVVFHGLGGRIEAGYIAIVSQGFPQLVRVSNDVVRPDNSRSFSERSPVLCQVRMLNETPLIPDLERLEVMTAEETSVVPERDAG